MTSTVIYLSIQRCFVNKGRAKYTANKETAHDLSTYYVMFNPCRRDWLPDRH